MRQVLSINDMWSFTKEDKEEYRSINVQTDKWEDVQIPHCWNALDGHTGGNNYYKGACWYRKKLNIEEVENKKVFIEFTGANSIADVYINEKHLGDHKGGYSTFRFDVTNELEDENILAVKVDNRVAEGVYPMAGDFTIFGGIYRDVNVIVVDKLHFDLMDYGSQGIYAIQDKVTDAEAKLMIKAKIKNEYKEEKNATLMIEILDGKNNVVKEISENIIIEANTNKEVSVNTMIENPILWNGIENPHLYTAKVKILCNNEELDNTNIDFGVRYFELDANKGFFLNGKPLKIKGVSRHQDRENMGNAITAKEKVEDIKLIKEMGANSIRLAHYQHDQYFYDLCDKEGMIVWAEIPFNTTITMPNNFSDTKVTGENAKQQMIELIRQNYNHPSIVFWGIQNEITITGMKPDTLRICKELSKLTKEEDATRIVVAANVGTVPIESELNKITDAIGYNLYYGWAYGELNDLGKFSDEFHEVNPTLKLGISEIGCGSVVKYHSDDPKKHDFSEEYQNLFHESSWKVIDERPYIWGIYIWNMFDFGSDLREEGGVPGINNKGLITYDRKIKKDSFYWYKANWSNEPVIYITSRRYEDRVSEKVDIKVYSNLGEVTLLVNGKKVKTLESDNKIFLFKNVRLEEGKNEIKAVSNKDESIVEDVINLNKVSEPNETYVFDSSAIDDGYTDWFQGLGIEIREDRFNINCKIGDIMENGEAKKVFLKCMSELPVAEQILGGINDKTMYAMLKKITLLKFFKHQPDVFTDDFIAMLNMELTKVKK